MSEVNIFCDMRESRSGVLERLSEMGATVKVGELETGDYVLSGDLVVERKTAVDFVASVMDGRLFNQLGKMKLNFSKPVVLIEGDVYATRSKITSEALDGALAYIVGIQGVNLLYTRNPRSAADLIYRMASHAQKGLDYDIAFRRGKVAPGQPEALFCIEGVTGIGPTLAGKVLNHFRSVHAFMNASMDDLLAVPGIGKTKAQRIYDSIRWKMPEGEEARSLASLFADPPASHNGT